MPIDKSTLDGLRIDRHDGIERRAPLWIVAGVVALLVVSLAAWFLIRRPGVVPVQVAAAQAVTGSAPGAVLNASGYVTARRQATVSSKVTGKVMQVNIEEGMHVKAGQVLARLDTSMSDKALRLAQAQASAAQSELAETRVRIAQAKLEYDRATSLARQQISSTSDLDRARAELRALEARLASQTESLDVAERQIALRRQDVDDNEIRAPFDGVVVTKDAQPGEMISPISAGSGFTRTGICTIVDMDSLEVDVDVAEAYINRIHTGQRAEAVLDAYPEWHIPAHVITPIPTADRQKATVKVRIAFDAKDPRILPEMGVKVSFFEDSAARPADASVSIPRAAVRRDGERDVVFVAANGRAERRAVRVVGAEGEMVRIGSGIAPGEPVIVEAPGTLKEGDAVRVEKEKG